MFIFALLHSNRHAISLVKAHNHLVFQRNYGNEGFMRKRRNLEKIDKISIMSRDKGFYTARNVADLTLEIK